MKHLRAATNIIFTVPPPLHLTNLLPCPAAISYNITIMRPLMSYLSHGPELLGEPTLRCAVMNQLPLKDIQIIHVVFEKFNITVGFK